MIIVIGPTLDQFNGPIIHLFSLRWGWCLERWDDKAAWEFWRRSKSCCNTEAGQPWKALKYAEIGIWQNMTKQRWGADIAKTIATTMTIWLRGTTRCNTIIKPTKRSKQHSKWVMLIVVKLKKLRTQERRLECGQHICQCQKAVDAASRMFPLLTRLIMFVKHCETRFHL